MLKNIYEDYTRGRYGSIIDASEVLIKGEGEEKYIKKYEGTKYADIDGSLERAKLIMEEIDNTKSNDTVLYRVECSPYKGIVYQVGDEITWGIRSFSRDKDFPIRALRGEDSGMESLAKLYRNEVYEGYKYGFPDKLRPVVYKLVGEKRYVDIAPYSKYKNQEESLVYGKFKVVSIEDTPKEDKIEKIDFIEEVKRNPDKYKLFKAKSGRDMVEVGGKVYPLGSKMREEYYYGGEGEEHTQQYLYQEQEWRNLTRPRIITIERLYDKTLAEYQKDVCRQRAKEIKEHLERITGKPIAELGKEIKKEQKTLLNPKQEDMEHDE